MTKRKCHQCTEMYEGRPVSKKFCSKQCYRKFYQKKCECCKNRIKDRTTTRQIYCNSICRNKYFNKL